MKNQTKKVFAIIPSAGYGTRFDAALPKQYFNINEELIIEKTINHFLEVDQIEKIMFGLDLYALPSHSDNFGITLIEALSKGIPVLISDKVNIYKKIIDYNCGKVIQNKPNEIEFSLHELIINTNKFRIMKENAINLIRSEYSWNIILPKYKKMYEKSMKI